MNIKKKVVTKRILIVFGCLIILYFLLMIPDATDSSAIIHSKEKPFSWNQDSLWHKLENDFRNAKQLGAEALDSSITTLKKQADERLHLLQVKPFGVTDSNLTLIRNDFFSLAPLMAVEAKQLQWYTTYYNAVRNLVKERSLSWNMRDPLSRNVVYGSLYGMRAALEEVFLQVDSSLIPAAMYVKNESSVTRTTKIFGIEVHSGDMLVSRGGAEVSALISRGNDYPGNFSHVALLYIDDKTLKPYLIEAHIEKGVAIASVEEYEHDKKLRFMVMRPRADLPAMIANPTLPQKAAQKVYDESLSRHIPYDFKMNFYDSSSMFCSEVASYAYRKNGLDLWQPVSTISSPGVVKWLNDFGVENFVTQMPADLEYDPQLSIVAEWREPGTLFKDHVDNAVMDAMLSLADKGREIHYSIWKLPVARLVKAYCLVKNFFGRTALIPEGMSATRALKNQTFVDMHVEIKKQTELKVEGFIQKNNYRPPYWQLVKMAEEAAIEY